MHPINLKLYSLKELIYIYCYMYNEIVYLCRFALAPHLPLYTSKTADEKARFANLERLKVGFRCFNA